MKRILFVSILLLLLSACVNLSVTHTPQSFQWKPPSQRAAELSKITAWRKVGAFSITLSDHTRQIAHFDWENTAKTYRLVISSALNLYHLTITKTPHGKITLLKNGRFLASANSAEQLMQQAIGWSLPVSPLKAWILGTPASGGVYHASYDVYGHILTLTQFGWKITYSDYKTGNNDVDFPQRIILKRSGVM